MASSNKTTNLQLNLWSSTDKPARTDFVHDNQKIDKAVGEHTLNSDIHLSESDRSKLTTPYMTTYYAGNGESSRSISIGFAPKVAIVFKKNSPQIKFNSSGVPIVNGAMIIASNGNTGGAVISGTNVTVSQASEANASTGLIYNLNESGGQYAVMAFK